MRLFLLCLLSPPHTFKKSEDLANWINGRKKKVWSVCWKCDYTPVLQLSSCLFFLSSVCCHALKKRQLWSVKKKKKNAHEEASHSQMKKALFTNQPEERIHLEFCEFKIACLELCEHRSLHLAVGCGVGWYHSRARSSASVWPFKICQPDPENPFFCRPFASALRGFYSRLLVSSSIQRWRLLAPLSIELVSHSGSTTPGQRLRVTPRKYLLAGQPRSVSNRKKKNQPWPAASDVCRAECLRCCQETFPWGDWLIRHFSSQIVAQRPRVALRWSKPIKAFGILNKHCIVMKVDDVAE